MTQEVCKKIYEQDSSLDLLLVNIPGSPERCSFCLHRAEASLKQGWSAVCRDALPQELQCLAEPALAPQPVQGTLRRQQGRLCAGRGKL